MNKLCILIVIVLIIFLLLGNKNSFVKSNKSELKVAILIIYDDRGERWKEEAKKWEIYMNMNENIDCFFIQCREGVNEIKPNYSIQSCIESSPPGIFQKTILTLKMLEGYDFYIRTNCSTFIIFDRLLKALAELPRNVPVYAGIYFERASDGAIWVQGIDITLNNLAKDILVKEGSKDEKFNWIKNADDVVIGNVFKENNIKITRKKWVYEWNYNESYDWNISRLKNDQPFLRMKYGNISQYKSIMDSLINKYY